MEKISAEFILCAIEKSECILISTHKKLCLPIISRIYKKMIYGIKFDDIKVHDNLIIDGHHRYVSSLFAHFTLNTVKSSKTSATIVYDWKDVEFVEEEWDTDFKIYQLNQLDAEFNNVTLAEIIKISK